MTLTRDEITTLRSLATEYARLAADPCHADKIAMWQRFNALQGERPMVLIDQIPWNELNVDGCLDNHVTHPYWRGVETWLLQEMYKWNHMPADMALDPYIKIPRPIHNSGWGLEPQVTRLMTETYDDVASQAIENLIQSMDDVAKIQTPRLTIDPAEQSAIANEADEVFGGIIPWQFTGLIMHLGAWDTITYWMGVENCYIELMDRPEMMHAVMEAMTRGYLSMIQDANRLQAFDTRGHYCHCSQTYRADDTASEEGTSHDTWAFGLAQLFTSVSPAITQEFECQYMKRIFPHFKHIYYGCCDRLDDRMEYVSALPNVRKMSCSPWSNREAFAEKLPGHIIMSNKPSPAMLATESLDEDAIRADLRRTMDAAKRHGKRLELILKDISTVRHEPWRLWRYSQIALEEAMR